MLLSSISLSTTFKVYWPIYYSEPRRHSWKINQNGRLSVQKGATYKESGRGFQPFSAEKRLKTDYNYLNDRGIGSGYGFESTDASSSGGGGGGGQAWSNGSGGEHKTSK